MTENNNNSEQLEKENQVLKFSEFLENIPPNQIYEIEELIETKYRLNIGNVDVIREPEIQLYCSDDMCNGTRFFRCTNKKDIDVDEDDFSFFYLYYRCSNCQQYQKVFSIAAIKKSGSSNGRCIKFGELPPFGPPTPSKLIKLIGPDRDLFLKGRRSENQGLGIGAFSYYRRVVENQKNRILDEIKKVSLKLNISGEIISELEAAKNETQFSKSIERIKHNIPQSLLINGHNPLLLLHKALSKGIHDKCDEECLELASSIRIILVELSERISLALKDEEEINKALSSLLDKNSN